MITKAQKPHTICFNPSQLCGHAFSRSVTAAQGQLPNMAPEPWWCLLFPASCWWLSVWVGYYSCWLPDCCNCGLAVMTVSWLLLLWVYCCYCGLAITTVGWLLSLLTLWLAIITCVGCCCYCCCGLAIITARWPSSLWLGCLLLLLLWVECCYCRLAVVTMAWLLFLWWMHTLSVPFCFLQTPTPGNTTSLHHMPAALHWQSHQHALQRTQHIPAVQIPVRLFSSL